MTTIHLVEDELNKAEELRKLNSKHGWHRGLEIVYANLMPGGAWYENSELEQITADEKLLVRFVKFVCQASDMHKSLANASWDAETVINQLSSWAQVKKRYLDNPIISTAVKTAPFGSEIRSESVDWGREIARNLVKPMQSLAMLLPSQQRDELERRVETMLRGSLRSMQQTDPTRALMLIEVLISQSRRTGSIPLEAEGAFDFLCQIRQTNKHRVQTVAFWLLFNRYTPIQLRWKAWDMAIELFELRRSYLSIPLKEAKKLLFLPLRRAWMIFDIKLEEISEFELTELLEALSKTDNLDL